MSNHSTPPNQSHVPECTGHLSIYCTVRSRYKRQLIQLNMNQSGLHGLEWMTRDPYSLVDDSLVTRTQCISVFSILADVVEVKTGSRATAHWSTHCIRLIGWLRNSFIQLIIPLDIDGIGQNWEDSNKFGSEHCGEKRIVSKAPSGPERRRGAPEPRQSRDSMYFFSPLTLLTLSHKRALHLRHSVRHCHPFRGPRRPARPKLFGRPPALCCERKVPRVRHDGCPRACHPSQQSQHKVERSNALCLSVRRG